jgi:ABC-type antimicrobial peptide transport system permease subunit
MDDLEIEGYTVTLSSQVVREQNRIEIAQQVAANLSVTIFLIAGGLLAFYFVMRSSMISRIYEISVYRALGVKKIELYNSFAVEIVMLTTISTFIGFVFMSIILNSISNSPLSNFFVFKIDPLIMLIGVVFVYLANLIIGLLPLGMLLRKTPAQIISSYDI